MPPRVKVQTRQTIVRMSLNGTSQGKVARAVGITQTSLNRVVDAFRDERRVRDIGRKCPRKTTEGEDNAMVEGSCEDPLITAGKIKDSTGLDVRSTLVF